ncbi:MAG: phospholipase D-like domain-containing protein, partial [Cyanobacteriota bacterium]|nr:phospholipase D-like domain-containing protein [Cyanobacteriota bacterium]
MLFALLFTVRFLVNRKASESTLKPLLEALPQDPNIQAYFNQSVASVYSEPYRQKTRFGDNLEQTIIDAIESANSTIDVAVQEFRLPQIAEALAKQHQAGVKVRVILENSYSRPWSDFTEQEVSQLSERDRDRYLEAVKLIDINQDGKLSPNEINERDALVILKNANIPWIDDTADGSKGSGLMHHKFVIVDGKTVIVTSANFTLSGVHGDLNTPESRGNANNLLKIESSKVAGLFIEEFNLMWGDGVGGQLNGKFGTKKPYRGVQSVAVGDTTVLVQFSPTPRTETWENSVNGLIGKTLSTAQESINFALFVFSDQALVNILEKNVQRAIAL